MYLTWRLGCLFLFGFCCLIQSNFKTATSKEQQCEQSTTSHHEKGMKDRAIKGLGYSFRNFTVSRIYDCHVKCFEEKCRCQAFQMLQNHCELLDEDRLTVPEDFGYKAGYAYFDMNREYVNQVSCSHACYGDNRCCDSNPCLNGGTCTELYDDAKHKFHCACTQWFFGRRCQKKVKSSKDYLQFRGSKTRSAVFKVFDSHDVPYEVYCDFESEKGFVWTVIESFTLANNNEFKHKPFYIDHPVNEQTFSWEEYRLSLKRMKETADRSTHVRATCNFNIEGLIYTDYLRAKTSDQDMVFAIQFSGCKKYELINFRGYSCQNCTCHFAQRNLWHAHIDSYYGSTRKGCQLTSPKTGAVDSEDDFRYYVTTNPVHRCVSRDNSTTQWWLGEKITNL